MPKFKLCPPEKPYYLMEVEEGKEYWWCSCGLSKNQPFCDGSHKTTDKTPIKFEAKHTKEVYFCGCKSTGNAPFCDGAHKKLC